MKRIPGLADAAPAFTSAPPTTTAVVRLKVSRTLLMRIVPPGTGGWAVSPPDVPR